VTLTSTIDLLATFHLLTPPFEVGGAWFTPESGGFKELKKKVQAADAN